MVGLGWVAQNRHIPCILRHPQARLVGVIDRRPDRIALCQRRIAGLKTAVTSAGTAEWFDEIDAVVVTTDPFSHYAVAKEALDNGKHVLVEKPFMLSPDEAEDVVKTSVKNRLICAVSHNFLYSRSFLKLEQLIGRGELGEIIGIEGYQWSNPSRRLPEWYERLPLGLFYDESPHLLYLIRELAGAEPTLRNVDIVLSKNGSQTPYSVFLSYDAVRFPIRVSMLYQATLSEWQLVVLGTKKVAFVDIFRDILMVVPNDGRHRAGNIINTSAVMIGSHLFGTLTTGMRMFAPGLFYGTEKITDIFINSVLDHQPPQKISSGDGSAVVNMQHQIKTRSWLMAA